MIQDLSWQRDVIMGISWTRVYLSLLYEFRRGNKIYEEPEMQFFLYKTRGNVKRKNMERSILYMNTPHLCHIRVTYCTESVPGVTIS